MEDFLLYTLKKYLTATWREKNKTLNGSRKAGEKSHLFFTVLCWEIYFSYVCIDGLD
jgi:hypothetical protein